jgi:carbonic anhydrase/acetyltransferase-like protein (isoleucine patch superfamily)
MNMKFETGNSASVITHHGFTPKIHPSAFLCEGVRIIGDVEIGENVSIWFNTVIRGDVHFIRIGDNTNIQDLCMLHVTNKKFPLVIGKNVSLGHSVSVHGCTINDGSLIGIGAIVLDGAVIGEESLVAAGSLVKQNYIVPPRTMVAGSPARVIRELTEKDLSMIRGTPMNYINYVNDYRLL